jgi:hypothetical protein
MVCLHLESIHIQKWKQVSIQTNSICLRELVARYCAFTDQKNDESLHALLALLGVDAKLRFVDFAHSLTQMQVSRVLVVIYRSPSTSLYKSKYSTMHLVEQVGAKSIETKSLAYEASRILYAISRARV